MLGDVEFDGESFLLQTFYHQSKSWGQKCTRKVFQKVEKVPIPGIFKSCSKIKSEGSILLRI